MMSFSEDTYFARLIPARIASYSISLLDVGKFSRIACSILSLVGGRSLRVHSSFEFNRISLYPSLGHHKA